MQAPKEFKDWINWGKKRKRGWAKKNGCLPNWFWDCPPMEIKLEQSKKNYKRHKEKRIRE